MKGNWRLSIARWIFSAFYLLAGVMRLIHSGTAAPFANPRAEALNSALKEAQFIDPLLAASLIVGGALLFFHRTAPLGIIIMAPMMVVFTLFHAVLNNAWWFGAITFMYFLLLAWAYRQAFIPLWNFNRQPPNNSFKPNLLRKSA